MLIGCLPIAKLVSLTTLSIWKFSDPLKCTHWASCMKGATEEQVEASQLHICFLEPSLATGK